MHKILLILIFLVGFLNSNAQVCIPANSTGTGKSYIVPDSTKGIAHGCPGYIYNETIYIKVPKDTSILISGVTLSANIDSFVLNMSNSSIGLPSYITIASNPSIKPANSSNPKLNFPHLTVRGDSVACIKLNGLVPIGTVPSTTNLTINMRIYAFITMAGIGIDTTAQNKYYKFVIDPLGSTSCISGISKYNNSDNLSDIKVSQNSSLNVSLNSKTNDDYIIQIYNFLGQKIDEKNWKVYNGINNNSFEINNYSVGTYILKIYNDSFNYNHLFTISK